MMQQTQRPTPRIHGGPDASGAAMFDFSTNSNACGPCPFALEAIHQADETQYPDASYTVLCRQLAAFHAVDVQRIVLAASASEFIFRISAMVAILGGRSICLPPHSFGDYFHAAEAHRLHVSYVGLADLNWACEPSSPLGQPHHGWPPASCSVCVLDRAYEPLRLSGEFAHSGYLDNVWQLYSPNKALGLTGVRAAYAIAPATAIEGNNANQITMNQLCPSWPIGADGVAMLSAWTRRDTQQWLTESLVTLRKWKLQQVVLCESLGWTVLPSLANFFVCRASVDADALRQHGIKLRDCTSFGLPGHVRVSVQTPTAQNALHDALLELKGEA